MKKIVPLFLATVALSAYSAIATTNAAYKASAGLVERPNSSKGAIVFVDTQSELNPSNITVAIQRLKEHLSRYTFKIEKSSSDEPLKLKKKYNANILIVIVNDDKTPPLLSAPDECWAIVNVKRLKEKLNNEFAVKKFFEPRCRKQIMRAFACAAGGIGSSFPGNIMSVSNIPDLDLCEEFMPFDKVSVFKRHMSSVGVLPAKYVSYRKACQEGWAPAPTNDVQKAIWERVKADKERGPTNPIEIPMPKKK